MARRVRWFRAQGIRVVLDMHQDLWGPATTGNGAPTWATYTDGLPTVCRGTRGRTRTSSPA